ncbi:hypothetical protein Tco_0785421 [Tanacetum coccineum]
MVQTLKAATILDDLRQSHTVVSNSQGRHVIPFHHFINNDLEYLRGDRRLSTQLNVESNDCQIRQIRPLRNLTLGQKAKTVLLLWTTRESARDVLLKKMDSCCDFHRLRIQDIEDIPASSRARKRVEEDLKWGCGKLSKESTSQKLTRYRSNSEKTSRLFTLLRCKRSHLPENKRQEESDLMRIDELHKFSDGTLDDVRTALNDRLKGIRMEYLATDFCEAKRDNSKCKSYEFRRLTKG